MDLKHTENKHVTSFFRDDRPAVRYQLIIHMLIGDSSNSYPVDIPLSPHVTCLTRMNSN